MANIRRIRTVMTGVAGVPYYSNLFFTWVSGTETAAVTAVAEFWEAMGNVIDNGLTMSIEGNVAVIDEATGVIQSFETTTTLTRPGLDTGDPLPTQTQGVLQNFTDLVVAGRRLRGRTYIPAPTEAMNTGGLPISDYRTALEVAGDQLITQSSTPGPWRVWSKTHGVSAVVEDVTAWTQWGVQRSRRQ